MALSEAFGFEERWLRLLIRRSLTIRSCFRLENLRSPEGMANAQHALGGIGNRQVRALRDWAKGIGSSRPAMGELS